MGRNANPLFLRYAQTFESSGGTWIVRPTAPVNTLPRADGGDAAGLGDINHFAADLLDSGNLAISFGFAPQFTVSSAKGDALGSETWPVGVANVLFNASNPTFQRGRLKFARHEQNLSHLMETDQMVRQLCADYGAMQRATTRRRRRCLKRSTGSRSGSPKSAVGPVLRSNLQGTGRLSHKVFPA